jgi:hypothetical protein
MLHDKDMMALMNNDDDDFSLIYIYIPIKENFQKIMNEEMLKKVCIITYASNATKLVLQQIMGLLNYTDLSTFSHWVSLPVCFSFVPLLMYNFFLFSFPSYSRKKGTC